MVTLKFVMACCIISILLMVYELMKGAKDHKAYYEQHQMDAFLLAADGREYPLTSSQMVIGKAWNADIVIDCPGVKRKEAKGMLQSIAKYDVMLRYFPEEKRWYVRNITAEDQAYCPLSSGESFHVGTRKFMLIVH